MRTLLAEIHRIEEQLADPEHSDSEGNKVGWVAWRIWRKNAMYARTKKTEEYIHIKDWVKQRRRMASHITPVHSLDGETSDVDLLAAALLALAHRLPFPERTDHEIALMDLLRDRVQMLRVMGTDVPTAGAIRVTTRNAPLDVNSPLTQRHRQAH